MRSISYAQQTLRSYSRQETVDPSQICCEARHSGFVVEQDHRGFVVEQDCWLGGPVAGMPQLFFVLTALRTAFLSVFTRLSIASSAQTAAATTLSTGVTRVRACNLSSLLVRSFASASVSTTTSTVSSFGRLFSKFTSYRACSLVSFSCAS
jgi:hypothetical protein